MATISTTSNLSDMSAIVIADSIQNVEPAGPTNQLVNRFDIPQGSKQINLPIWGRMTASALTEGQDLQTAKQLAVTVRNLTATFTTKQRIRPTTDRPHAGKGHWPTP